MQEVFQLVATLGERFTGPSGQGLKVAAKLLAKTPGAGRSRAGA